MNHAQSIETVEPPVGELAARPDVIRFPKGIPGFEGCRGFVLMTQDQDHGLCYLKAVDGPPASFLVIDPRHVLPGYRCELTDGDRERLHAHDGTPLLWLALLSVETDGSVVVNLRAPVVVNPERMIGAQVIPHHCLYPLRHVLVASE